MNILAFDTTMAACSAAILRTGGIQPGLVQSYEVLEKGHAEKIVPMIQSVMKEAGLSFSDVDLIAVTTGPGTFTGVRIGIATAKGLRFASNKNSVGISSLRVIAEKGARSYPEGGYNAIAVAIDARRNQIYFQIFNEDRKPLSDPMVCDPGFAASLLPKKKVLIIGSGARFLLEEKDSGSGTIETRLAEVLPDAATLASIAADESDIDPELRPLYLRRPDAKSQMGKSIPRTPQ